MSDFATAPIHCFVRTDYDFEFISMFHPYKDYPIYFMSDSEDGAIQKAEDFRNEQLTKVKHIRQVRQENMKKAKAAKQRKGIK